MNRLIKYTAACNALAEAKNIDEVKNIRDKAEAMRAYAKQAKNRDLEVDAAEIRMRAERCLGGMIIKQKETVGLAKGSRGNQHTGLLPREKESIPTLKEAGIDHKLSSRSQKLAAVPEKEFEDMIGEWRDKVAHENERVTVNLIRAGEQARRDEEFQEQEMVWPSGKYGLIYADPPWRYENPPMGGGNRSIENHYPTMTLEEICALPVPELTLDDSMLLLWTTAPKLEESLAVINAWGFTYRTGMVWVKDKIGMGYHVRSQHEHLLIAKKGTPPVPEPSDRPPSVFEAPRNKHSAKPLEYYDLIESMYPNLPRVELFSRTPRDGWNTWGFEADA